MLKWEPMEKGIRFTQVDDDEKKKQKKKNGTHWMSRERQCDNLNACAIFTSFFFLLFLSFNVHLCAGVTRQWRKITFGSCHWHIVNLAFVSIKIRIHCWFCSHSTHTHTRKYETIATTNSMRWNPRRMSFNLINLTNLN